jgi:UPF0271 protein
MANEPSSAARGVVDLNADFGEAVDEKGWTGEERLLSLVTSVSIACGGHAGDRASMRRAVAAAARRGVAVGAHPSYPDRDGFGRRPMRMPAEVLRAAVGVQVAALAGIAAELGVAVGHVKPHGALYHAAGRDPEVAAAVAAGVAAAGGEGWVLVGQAGSPGLAAWQRLGWRVAAEGFVDRRYEADGSLRDRAVAGAVLDDPAEAAAQAVELARRGDVATLCVHGDNPQAVALVAAVRRALATAGIEVAPLVGPGTRRR